jgi:hypothetical protein
MIRRDLSTTTDMVLEFPSGTLTVPYSGFMGLQPDMSDPVQAAQVEAAIQAWIYSQLDERERRNRLPQDDPARDTDPAQEGYFWDGQDIVTRPYIIGVRWDGERFQYSVRYPQR